MCYQSVHVYNYLFYVLYCSPLLKTLHFNIYCISVDLRIVHVHIINSIPMSVLFIMRYGVVSLGRCVRVCAHA